MKYPENSEILIQFCRYQCEDGIRALYFGLSNDVAFNPRSSPTEPALKAPSGAMPSLIALRTGHTGQQCEQEVGCNVQSKKTGCPDSFKRKISFLSPRFW